jgi:ATPase subunit of ABC transporter with duplicated ATPase domains
VFVRFDRLDFSYVDSVPIIAGATFQLTSGWTGVVGANGAGKSSLLKLIAGELEPSGGAIFFDPPSARVALCPQTVEQLTLAITEFAATVDGMSRRIMGELALDSDDLARWPTLSPGERKRWQVGAALAAEPQVLMLDEPTDHLDLEARELLTAGLMRYRGVGIIVSHDRTLLEVLTANTLRLDQTTARLWRGGYSIANSSWEAEAREHRDEYERLKHQRVTLARRLADKRRIATAAEANASAGAGKRMKGPRDHDATGMLAKGKARMASERISREAGLLRASVDRVDERLGEFTFRKEKGTSIFVDYVPAPVAKVLTLDQDAVCAGDEPILRDVHLVVKRDSRIFVAGPNGAGKTTLLAALMRGAHVPAERLLHLPQELTARDGAAMLDAVRALGAAARGRVLSVVAALGIDPDRLLESHQPSPGEARKLALAWGLGRQAWALVLDEPTNHLDIPAIERLELALIEYPGALVIVTHDDGLARQCTNERWRVGHGRVEVE